MKVSVISTVYNGESYFDRAVPSILGQSHEDFEYVIVDDGSEDGTLSLLLELADSDPRVRVIQGGRAGRVKALNRAVEAARGEYIVQQDFDDTSAKGRIKEQVAFLDQNPRVGVVGGHYVVIDENRGERYVRRPPADHDSLVRAMARYIPIAHTVATFRKAAWEEAGGYPELEDIEDLRLWITFVSKGWSLANIPAIVGEHYIHAASFWHRTYSYRDRQRSLGIVQRQAVRELGLPRWMVLYSAVRPLYARLPDTVKRVVRRKLAGSSELDLSVPEHTT